MKNRLYTIRTQKGLTLQDVSDLYKINFDEKLSAKKLKLIEEDKVTCDFITYIHLASLLDVTVDYFLCRTEEHSEELRMHQKGLVETYD